MTSIQPQRSESYLATAENAREVAERYDNEANYYDDGDVKNALKAYATGYKDMRNRFLDLVADELHAEPEGARSQDKT